MNTRQLEQDYKNDMHLADTIYNQTEALRLYWRARRTHAILERRAKYPQWIQRFLWGGLVTL